MSAPDRLPPDARHALPADVVEALVAQLADGPDALCLVGDDGIIRWANRAATILHARALPIVDGPVATLIAADGDDHLLAAVRDAIASGAPRSVLPAPDGGGRWVAATLTATGLGSALVSTWDVTTRMRQARWLAVQAALLERVAAGAPIGETLTALAVEIEALSGRATVSVLRVSDDGRLYPLAGPNLPAGFSDSVTGVRIGPAAGSCGTAAWRRSTVLVADIATDPLWATAASHVLRFGFRASWSVPIVVGTLEGPRAVGTFAMYMREPGLPDAHERRLLEEAARVVRVAFAAEAMRVEQAQLVRILEETPDLVSTRTPDGRILFMNRAARAFVVGPDAGAPGRTRALDLVRVLAPCDPPDDPCAHAVRAGAWSGDVLLRRHDGVQLPMLLLTIAHHDDDGVIRFVSTTARDLSAVRTAEAALAASEARFRALTDAAPVGVYETDPEWRCTYVNRHLLSITGLDLAGQLGDAWRAHIHPDDMPSIDAAWSEYRRTGVMPLTTYRFIRPDGSVRHLIGTCAPMTDHTGAITGHVGIVQDITAARAEEENQEAVRRERAELAARAQHAQRMEALGALAGGVAHDFNNLLSVLRGGLELLRDEVAPGSEARTEVDELLGATERATGMTQRLLAFSRHQVLQPTAVEVNAVVESASALLRRLVGEHIAVRTALGELPGTVRADRGQLEQVLVNLVVNARDAMPDGGEVVIETAATIGGDEAHWPGPRDASLVRLVVRDTGCGMDEATIARAMEPFFTTKPLGRGTGLGLSMAYGVVAQSGGALAIGSRPGHGTTVTVLLPLDTTVAIPETRPPADDTPPPAAPAPAGAPRACVLVVEDEASLRLVMRRTLERAGYDVCEAADGTEGLALWRARRQETRAIVTDLRMPGLGGREMVAAIRADGSAVPVVYVSGYADESFALEASRERFLAKPFPGSALVAALAQLGERGAASP